MSGIEVSCDDGMFVLESLLKNLFIQKGVVSGVVWWHKVCSDV